VNRKQRKKGKALRAERSRVEKARQVRTQERRVAFLRRVAEGERRGCLFCRKSDGGFTTAEHSLSHSIGNTEVVLENGIVCDRCNNGVLSQLDQALAEFWPLQMRRTWLGVPSKSGKVPVTRFSTGTLTNKGDNNIFMELHSAKDKGSLRTTEMGGGVVKGEMQLTGGRRMTPRYSSELSRSLLKAAFECAWLDHGDEVLKPEFDHVRDAVLGVPRDGYLAVIRKGYPEVASLEIMYTFVPTETGRILAVAANLYGVLVGTDSRNAEPLLPVDDDRAMIVRFTVNDLQPRDRRGNSGNA
jgi:hypothetical protein